MRGGVSYAAGLRRLNAGKLLFDTVRIWKDHITIDPHKGPWYKVSAAMEKVSKLNGIE